MLRWRHRMEMDSAFRRTLLCPSSRWFDCSVFLRLEVERQDGFRNIESTSKRNHCPRIGAASVTCRRVILKSRGTLISFGLCFVSHSVTLFKTRVFCASRTPTLHVRISIRTCVCLHACILCVCVYTRWRARIGYFNLADLPYPLHNGTKCICT